MVEGDKKKLERMTRLTSEGNGYTTSLERLGSEMDSYNPIQDIIIHVFPNNDSEVIIRIIENLVDPIIDDVTGRELFSKVHTVKGRCAGIDAHLFFEQDAIDVLERCTINENIYAVEMDKERRGELNE